MGTAPQGGTEAVWGGGQHPRSGAAEGAIKALPREWPLRNTVFGLVEPGGRIVTVKDSYGAWRIL